MLGYFTETAESNENAISMLKPPKTCPEKSDNYTATLKKYGNELSNAQIAKLIGSTKSTIEAIKKGTYREAITEAKSPMDVGLCTYQELE